MKTKHLVVAAAAGGAILAFVAAALFFRNAACKDEHSRGMAFFEQGDNIRAAEAFSRLTDRCETDIAARYWLGAARHNYGAAEEAEAHYGAVLEMAMEYGARAAHSAARLAYARGDAQSALRLLETALILRPGSGDIEAEYAAVLQAQDGTSDGEAGGDAAGGVPAGDLFETGNDLQ